MLRFYAVAALLHTYIAWRLVPDLPYGIAATVATTALIAASAVLVPLGFAARRSRGGATLLGWSGLVALGLFSSLIVLTLARDAVLLGIMLARPWLDIGIADSVTGSSAAAVPLVALLATIVGFVNARRNAAVREIDVPIAGLAPSLHGFTIAQISDLHVGPTIRRRYVERVVERVNQLEVDLVAVTGDLVDGTVRELADHVAPLSTLQARHGAFFVTGNHEYYSGARAWAAELTRLGLRVLTNEHVVVEHRGGKLVVAGVTDYGAHHFDRSQRSDPVAALAGAPADATVRVLLAHQPRSAFEAARAGYTLQLSGHTHGGQFLPWNFLVRLWQPFTAGLSRLGELWVYTSRGTGYWGPPKRFGAPSEITRLRLVPA